MGLAPEHLAALVEAEGLGLALVERVHQDKATLVVQRQMVIAAAAAAGQTL